MFKDEFKSVIDAQEKFWTRENKSRPILNFSYTKNPNLEPYPAPASPAQKFLDEKYILGSYRYMTERNGYIAEGYPKLNSNVGPGSLAAFVGGNYQLGDNTIWFDHTQFVTDWENPPSISFDENSELWQHLIRLQNYYGANDAHFAMTDIGGVLDVVAALRKTEDLLYDLYDYPDEVIEFSKKVQVEWLKAFDKQVEIMAKYNQPYDTWMGILSNIPYYPVQCDFCYMLSPDNFDDFVFDDLSDLISKLPRSIYHLDGVGELTHVDKIVEIEKLNGIQWTSGAGHEPLWDAKWLDLYRKIQDKKKNLVLLGGINENAMDSFERLIKSIDPIGVYVSGHFSSKEKAEDAIEKITKWCE